MGSTIMHFIVMTLFYRSVMDLPNNVVFWALDAQMLHPFEGLRILSNLYFNPYAMQETRRSRTGDGNFPCQ